MGKSWQLSPTVVGVMLWVMTQNALAELSTSEINSTGVSSLESTTLDDNEWRQTNDPLSQITKVSQLRDISPGDWAYEALRSLLEKYGVVAGYPDGSFRGEGVLTRNEFAAALWAILEKVNSQPELLLSEEQVLLKRLTEEFTLELALLRADVDGITARTTELSLTSFSTTTQLKGDVVLGLVSLVGGEDINGKAVDDGFIFGHRTRLNLETSFTGEDLLSTRLQAEGLGSLQNRTLTPEGELSFTGATDSDVQIDELLYRFQPGSRTQVVIIANGGDADDLISTINPYLDGDGDRGALSRFASRPSIYYQVKGAGIGITHRLGEKVELGLGYLADNSGDPTAGLFNGSYGAIAQVSFEPFEGGTIGLSYLNAYNQFLTTGSNSANLLGLSTLSNSYGVEATVAVSPQLVLGGWVGYTAARVIGQGDASIWNWAVSLVFPNLGNSGNVGGLIIGMEPKVTQRDNTLVSLGINDPDTSLHIEAIYEYQLTDNITITPGVIWLTAPNHNSSNDMVIFGVRARLSF